MTDRVKGCWVAFTGDIREDDIKPVIDSIKQLRGVAAVETKLVDSNDWINRAVIKREIIDKIWDLLK